MRRGRAALLLALCCAAFIDLNGASQKTGVTSPPPAAAAAFTLVWRDANAFWERNKALLASPSTSRKSVTVQVDVQYIADGSPPPLSIFWLKQDRSLKFQLRCSTRRPCLLTTYPGQIFVIAEPRADREMNVRAVYNATTLPRQTLIVGRAAPLACAPRLPADYNKVVYESSDESDPENEEFQHWDLSGGPWEKRYARVDLREGGTRAGTTFERLFLRFPLASLGQEHLLGDGSNGEEPMDDLPLLASALKELTRENPPANLSAAVELFYRAADNGGPFAYVYLSALHASGLLTGLDAEKEGVTSASAAEGSSFWAMCATESGVGAPLEGPALLLYQNFPGSEGVDCAETLETYSVMTTLLDGLPWVSEGGQYLPLGSTRLGTDSGHGVVNIHRTPYGLDMREQADLLLGLDAQDSKALAIQGYMHLMGVPELDIPQNLAAARQLFEQAAEMGEGFALTQLGFMALRANHTAAPPSSVDANSEDSDEAAVSSSYIPPGALDGYYAQFYSGAGPGSRWSGGGSSGGRGGAAAAAAGPAAAAAAAGGAPPRRALGLAGRSSSDGSSSSSETTFHSSENNSNGRATDSDDYRYSVERAADYFRRAVEAGEPDAASALAELHLRAEVGNRSDADVARAQELLRWAAEEGDATAFWLLGDMAFAGQIGVDEGMRERGEVNETLALHYWEQATSLGAFSAFLDRAQLMQAQAEENDDPELCLAAARLYKAYVDATLEMHDMYFAKRKHEQNEIMAGFLGYLMAAELGNRDAQASMAWLLTHHGSTPPLSTFLESAASFVKANHPTRQPPTARKMALRYLSNAAEQGDSEALCSLGEENYRDALSARKYLEQMRQKALFLRRDAEDFVRAGRQQLAQQQLAQQHSAEQLVQQEREAAAAALGGGQNQKLSDVIRNQKQKREELLAALQEGRRAQDARDARAEDVESYYAAKVAPAIDKAFQAAAQCWQFATRLGGAGGPGARRAHFNLGYMLEWGLGTPRNYSAAREHYALSNTAPATLALILLELRLYLAGSATLQLLAVLAAVTFGFATAWLALVMLRRRLPVLRVRRQSLSARSRTEREPASEVARPGMAVSSGGGGSGVSASGSASSGSGSGNSDSKSTSGSDAVNGSSSGSSSNGSSGGSSGGVSSGRESNSQNDETAASNSIAAPSAVAALAEGGASHDSRSVAEPLGSAEGAPSGVGQRVCNGGSVVTDTSVVNENGGHSQRQQIEQQSAQHNEQRIQPESGSEAAAAAGERAREASPPSPRSRVPVEAVVAAVVAAAAAWWIGG